MRNKIEKLLNSGRLRLIIVVGFALLSVGGYSSVNADEDGEVSALETSPEPTKEVLSPREQLSWVRERTAAAKTIVKQISLKLEKARKDKDTLKITCLDDKLAQLQLTLRGVEERTKSLEVSIQTGNTTTADQNFAILKIYLDRVSQLNAEGENCLGEADVVLGKTETTTTVDPNIATYDPIDQREGIPIDLGTAPPNELSGHL
jgi:hypothetical protein